MNVRIIRGAEVTRPTPTPLKSSVLDHASVVGKSDFGLRNNAGLWPSYNCLDVLVPAPMCPDPLLGSEEGSGFKQFSVAEWVPAYEFAVYGAVQCGAVGLDKDDQKSEVERVFRANAGKGVERSLLENRFVARVLGSDEVGPEWDAPVDLGDFDRLSYAMAALEGYAAAVYSGAPTLHMPRALVHIAFGLGLLREEGGLFYTKTGAKVAAGGGYDSDEAPTGSYDLFATGEVYVEQSDEVSVQTITIPGDGSGIGSEQNGLADNTVVALAERMFRVGVDCFVATASVTLWTDGSI